ncbi:MAG: anti-sigma factor family protein [Gemmata sp.]
MTADQRELIAAAVDGELSGTEERAFRLLLATSAQARQLYEKLQADSKRVRSLSRVAPPADLQTRILTKLAGATPPRKPNADPKPVHRPHAPSRRGLSAMAPFALAASVFLCLATASFLYLTRGTGVKDIAKTNWTNVLPGPQEGGAVGAAPATPTPDPVSVVRNNVSPVPPPVLPKPRDVVPDKSAFAIAPEPRSVASADLIGFPLLPKLPPVDRVDARLPFLRPVADLGREDLRQELTDELTRDQSAFKFDLFVRDTGRGWEVFQHAAKATGLPVMADAATLDKLKKKQLHAFAVYTESLSPTELATLFAKLSVEDTKFSPKVCDSLHATPVVRSDELELKALLGVDVGLFKRPFGSGGAPQLSDPKGVSAGTIDTVVKSVNKGDKCAVLLTWQTAPGPITRTNPSAEVKTYLSKRGERKPTAIPAIIVIRIAG